MASFYEEILIISYLLFVSLFVFAFFLFLSLLLKLWSTWTLNCWNINHDEFLFEILI